MVRRIIHWLRRAIASVQTNILTLWHNIIHGMRQWWKHPMTWLCTGLCVVLFSGHVRLARTEQMLRQTQDTLIAMDETMTTLRLAAGLEPHPLVQRTAMPPARPTAPQTWLLAGMNEGNMDTILLIHIVPQTRSFHVVSLPRDLKVHGRKINHYATTYGMPQFLAVLAHLTGYEVHHYVRIDMLAFAAVIDALGGIDVELTERLVDPSYRVVADDGTETTLDYPPGRHHLNGTAALRIVRSRATTSDFDRAQRQQLIIAALREKAATLSLRDARMLWTIATTLFRHIETDLSFAALLRTYVQWHDYTVGRTGVASTANILTVVWAPTPQECATLVAEAQERALPPPACTTDQRSYLLVPKGEDWSLLRRFVRQHFDSPASDTHTVAAPLPQG